MRVKYHNVNLLIHGGPNGSYSLRIDSPFGQANNPFNLEALLTSAHEIRGAFRSLRFEEARRDSEGFGRRLFQSVFRPDDAAKIIEAAYNATETVESDTRIRLRLQYTSVPQAAEIPWELLYWDRSGFEDYLALHRSFTIVRYLDLAEAPRPTKVTRLPLNILGLIVDRSNTLDSETERKTLEALTIAEDGRWAAILPGFFYRFLLQKKWLRPGQPLVKTTFLSQADLLELQNALDREDYHIFHFIGHSEQGRIRLEYDLEGQDSTNDVLRLLAAERHLSLAVFNSCEGAVSSPEDAFSGIAQKLIRKSVPAVVGMQFPISDGAALLFAGTFYQRLAEGRPIDEAMSSGRRALAASEKAEWATPVLYMRSADGLIFDVRGRPKTRKKPLGRILLTGAVNLVGFVVLILGLLSFIQYLPFLPAYKVLVVGGRGAEYRHLDEELLTGLSTAFNQSEMKEEFAKFFHKPVAVQGTPFGEAVAQLRCDGLFPVLCLLERRRILAVFAPPSSTDAQAFLDEIPDEFPRPIFLIGTNPRLTNPINCDSSSGSGSHRRSNVFRLTPNDYHQAKEMVGLVRKHGEPKWSVAIVSDSSNRLYASGLERLVRKEFARCTNCPTVAWPPEDPDRVGETCENAVETPSVVSSGQLELLKGNIKVLIYIGTPESARAFLYRIERAGWEPKIKLLSDSSVNPRFIRNTELKPEVLSGVYGVFPHGKASANLPEALRADQPGIQLIAWDAAKVMLQCLYQLHPHDFPFIDRPTVTSLKRPDLLKVLNQRRDRRRLRIQGDAGYYLFDSYGNNREAAFHPWQILPVGSPEGLREGLTGDGQTAALSTVEQPGEPMRDGARLEDGSQDGAENEADEDGIHKDRAERYAWTPIGGTLK